MRRSSSSTCRVSCCCICRTASTPHSGSPIVCESLGRTILTMSPSITMARASRSKYRSSTSVSMSLRCNARPQSVSCDRRRLNSVLVNTVSSRDGASTVARKRRAARCVSDDTRTAHLNIRTYDPSTTHTSPVRVISAQLVRQGPPPRRAQDPLCQERRDRRPRAKGRAPCDVFAHAHPLRTACSVVNSHSHAHRASDVCECPSIGRAVIHDKHQCMFTSNALPTRVRERAQPPSDVRSKRRRITYPIPAYVRIQRDQRGSDASHAREQKRLHRGPRLG